MERPRRGWIRLPHQNHPRRGRRRYAPCARAANVSDKAVPPSRRRPAPSTAGPHPRGDDPAVALPCGSVVLAEDETHPDLLARVRACWTPVMDGARHPLTSEVNWRTEQPPLAM